LNLKNYFVAVILTGLMLALAFNHLAGSQTSPSAQYDPWADLNDDGKISMDEIVKACELFGTTGDPTKPVIINHNWKEGNYSFSLNPGGYTSLNIPTIGFRTVTIRILAYSTDTHKFQLSIEPKVTGSICDRLDCVVSSHTPFVPLIIPPYPWYNDKPANFKQSYEITFSELMIGIYNNSTTNTLWGTIYYYLNT